MPLTIDPPLLNSATPWATDLADLKALYDSPYTGAVTTRTSMLNGFRHNPKHHQYTFFDPSNHAVTPNAKKPKEYATSSLNTLGYSPKRLKEYLVFISQIAKGLGNQVKDATNEGRPVAKAKPFIISVTGTPDEVAECYRLICLHQAMVPMPLAMEVNLSCPNIPGQPPPAYSGESLAKYLSALKNAIPSPPEFGSNEDLSRPQDILTRTISARDVPVPDPNGDDKDGDYDRILKWAESYSARASQGKSPPVIREEPAPIKKGNPPQKLGLAPPGDSHDYAEGTSPMDPPALRRLITARDVPVTEDDDATEESQGQCILKWAQDYAAASSMEKPGDDFFSAGATQPTIAAAELQTPSPPSNGNELNNPVEDEDQEEETETEPEPPRLSRVISARDVPVNTHHKDELSWVKEYTTASRSRSRSIAPHEVFPPLTLRSSAPVPIGLKTPPYTQADQFCTLVDELCKSATGSGKRKTCCPISFLTCTNTLGFSLLLDEAGPVLNSLDGSGVGGLGGAALHPLALGNVRTISAALKAHRETRHVRVIGVGGVSDKAGFERMRMAGAGAVGVGTAVGREGVGIFEKIMG